LATPAIAYPAKLNVAVRRTTAAATVIVPKVFFMIRYLPWSLFVLFDFIYCGKRAKYGQQCN
jgi:hypothetical protein